jgi:hypothetical protein
MLVRFRPRRPSHTTVAAYLALFLVLTGGTAVALTGKNTVFSDDITDGQVKNKDIGSEAVGPAKVKDETLTGQDIKPNSVSGARIVDNSIKGIDVDERSLQGFESVATVSSGGAVITSSTRTKMLEWFEAGIQVTNDEDGDSKEEIRIRNIHGGGNLIGRVTGGNSFGVAPGNSTQVGDSTADGKLEAVVINVLDDTQQLLVNCLFNPVGGIKKVRCWGIRS